VPYDEELAARVRVALGDVSAVTEIKMFGGLCFTVRGHMAVGVMKDGGLLVRVDPEDDRALTEPGAGPMDFTGKPMRGFLLVDPAAVRTQRSLRRWVDRGVTFASSLPPKRPKAKKAV
jgi:TfoX/Sxy family transcriptional regulator of competence genes